MHLASVLSYIIILPACRTVPANQFVRSCVILRNSKYVNCSEPVLSQPKDNRRNSSHHRAGRYNSSRVFGRSLRMSPLYSDLHFSGFSAEHLCQENKSPAVFTGVDNVTG